MTLSVVKQISKRGVTACIVMFVFACCALMGCSQADAEIQEGVPSWIDETTALEQTYEVIELFNAFEYEAVSTKFADGVITADDIDEALSESQAEFGTFVSYGEVQYLNGESSGESYVCVIQEVQYENGLAEFRISFFEDESLAGFYFLTATE